MHYTGSLHASAALDGGRSSAIKRQTASHPKPKCNNRNDQRRRVKIADIRHDSAVTTSIHQTLCSAEGPVDALIG